MGELLVRKPTCMERSSTPRRSISRWKCGSMLRDTNRCEMFFDVCLVVQSAYSQVKQVSDMCCMFYNASTLNQRLPVSTCGSCGQHESHVLRGQVVQPALGHLTGYGHKLHIRRYHINQSTVADVGSAAGFSYRSHAGRS